MVAMVCRVDFKSKDTLDHYGLSEQIHTTPSIRMICKNIQILFSKLFEFRFQQNMILNFVFPTSLSVSSGFVLFFFVCFVSFVIVSPRSPKTGNEAGLVWFLRAGKQKPVFFTWLKI